MFQKILVPTDLSQKSKRAVDIAVGIARLDHGEIYLLHVIELIPHSSFEEFAEFYDKLQLQAQKRIDEFMPSDVEETIKTHNVIVFGNRVQEILRFAESYEIDLIVMNSHRVEPNSPTLGWGTISYKVVALSQCPTMLVK